MKILIIGLLVYTIASTLTIVVLGTLLSKCKSNISADKVRGDKNSVEKEEYGIFVVDNAEEGTCNCEGGTATIGWTILEIIVTGVIGIMILAMLLKGILMSAIAIKERKLRRAMEEQKKQQELRNQIRMEERNRQQSIDEENAIGVDNLK